MAKEGKINFNPEKMEKFLTGSELIQNSLEDVVVWQNKINEQTSMIVDVYEQQAKGYIASIEAIGDILEECAALHKPGGKLYTLTEQILRSYNKMKFVTLAKKSAIELDGYIDAGAGEEERFYRRDTPIRYSERDFELDFTQADLFDAMNESDNVLKGQGVLNKFLSSREFELYGVVVYLVDRAIELMSNSENATEESKKYASILKEAYMSRNSQSLKNEDIAMRLDISLATYHNYRRSAIEMASFLILPDPMHEESSLLYGNNGFILKEVKTNLMAV